MKKSLSILFFFFLIAGHVSATHNRAGEITYRQVSQFTYEATIVTYTNTKETQADRCSLPLNWGDGVTQDIPRVNGTSLNGCLHWGVDIGADTKINYYTAQHNYSGPGTFIMSVEDPNRNAGIVNFTSPGFPSVDVPFYIETELIISPFLGFNSTPVLLNPPIDNATVNQLFIHNPGAYDAEGDSISYKLVNCMGAGGLAVPGYVLPSSISPGPNNLISIDALTGDMAWNSPKQLGEYNIAILITEWRSGIKIGSILRDMQITVVPSLNQPPQINVIPEICVDAGTFINIPVTATDPDALDVITLTATGGPFLQPSSPAIFNQPISGQGSVSSPFMWQTNCSHVKKYPYQVVFKAEDNDGNTIPPVHLVDMQTLRITVVAPAPLNLAAVPIGKTISLSWDPCICTEAIGYKIYRKEDSYGFVPTQCETGVPAYTGFEEIAQTDGLNATSYLDNDNGKGLIRGIQYCYMVFAFFEDGAESYASAEVCTDLKKDVPVITNVSIETTSQTNGKVFVAWSKPTELDTILFPGPYEYRVFRANNFTGSNAVAIKSFSALNDTLMVDSNLNTKDNPYSYRIDFYNDPNGSNTLIGSSEKASSPFLLITPADNQLQLTWEEHVPWRNNKYVVYKYNNTTLAFDSIDTTSVPSYVDKNLDNGRTYCYKIKTVGEYSAGGFIDPIENYSQENCGVPVDLTPPCPPALQVMGDCDLVRNFLSWTNPNNSCADDVLKYNIYFKASTNDPYQLHTVITNATDTSFFHQNTNSIAGCYYVTAVDSVNNESAASNEICIDNCPLYTLPNVFTADGDGVNDLFIPLPYRFVRDIDLFIFNRWGQLVFKTTNPDINWDGRNMNTNELCSDGVYFYTCVVNEIRLSGIEPRTLKGFVHLLNGKKNKSAN